MSKPATTSRTKTEPGLIELAKIDTDTEYFAVDEDGDWVMTMSHLATLDAAVISYERDAVVAARDHPNKMAHARILSEALKENTILLRCTALKSYIICGALGKLIKDCGDVERVPTKLIVRADLLVGAAESVSAKIGWEFQAFILPDRGAEPTAPANDS
jgi:hypothetical protein